MEFLRHVPPPALAPFVASAHGYRVPPFATGLHRGLPSPCLTLVIELGAPLTVTGLGATARSHGIACGLHTRPALIDASAPMDGLQYALAPLGCRALLGVPAAELHDLPVALTDLLGPGAAETLEQVHDARSWTERFAALDRALLRLLDDDAPAPPAAVAEAWRLVVAGRGRTPVTAIAAQLSWSRRHLSEQFRRATGLSPKQASRVVRFETVKELLTGPFPLAPAQAALAAGYADQAHMVREWHALAGCAPGAWLREELPFVQDAVPAGGPHSGA